MRTPVDELHIAGALRGRPVEVCRGVTVDVDVPARAEVVVEGRIRPSQRADEGPLAEFHGYHGEMWPSPTVEVTAISWRHSPVYQTIIPGWYEHVFIGNVLPREPLLRRFVRHIDPHADVHIPPYGQRVPGRHPDRARQPGHAQELGHGGPGGPHSTSAT